MTLDIKDAYEQSLKKNSLARRNPNADAGTNATVRYMRSTVDMEQFTPGVGKILHNFGKGVMIGEEEINGIEDVIESNPDVTIIDNTTGYAVRIRSDVRLYEPALLDEEAITRMTEEFIEENGREPNDKEQTKILRKGTITPAVYEGDAEHFNPSDTQRLLRKTSGHGYKRFGMKVQRNTQRLNMKVLLVMFAETTASILKLDGEQIGRLLNSVYKKSKRMNDKINSMEKAQGSRHIRDYINNTKHGGDMVEAMYTHATGKQILSEKVGDTHLAILVEELKMVGAVDE